MAKLAVVTGASTGIGLELSRLLATDGYELVLVARDAKRLNEVAAELGASKGLKVQVMAADLADPQSAKRIAADLNGRSVDVLINNAGFGICGEFRSTDVQTELDMIQVNVTSLVELTKHFLPGMLARNAGRIMNVASIAGFLPGPRMSIYYASKAFVLSFSEAISEELRGTGVSVTALCPGPTRSEFQKRAQFTAAKQARQESLGMMSSAAVAAIGYRGMMAGEVIVIPGPLNKLAIQALRIAPRSIVRKFVKKMQEG